MGGLDRGVWEVLFHGGRLYFRYCLRTLCCIFWENRWRLGTVGAVLMLLRVLVSWMCGLRDMYSILFCCC